MNPRTFSVVALVVLLAMPGDVSAQPLQLPGAGTSAPAGTVQPPARPSAGGASSPSQAPATLPSALPGARRSVSTPVRPVAEDAVVNMPLKHNGSQGQWTMVRDQRGYRVRLAVSGFETGNLSEPCEVSFIDQPIQLEALGRPLGLPRFRLASSVCPIVFDVLNGAVLVVEPQAPCVIEAARCRIDPRGLWGPDSRTLVARARTTEQERSRAEAQVREGYRVLVQRTPREEKRTVTREQAAFTSDRTTLCRDFRREGQHGFCAARISEARAAALQARIAAMVPEKPARR